VSAGAPGGPQAAERAAVSDAEPGGARAAPRPAARAAGWRARDHVRGRLLGSLAVLAVPLVAGSLAQAGFQLAEFAFLARLGEEPMAAVIIANQSVRQLVLMLVLGGSFGTQALVARAVGGGRAEEAEHVAGQAVVLGALFAAALAGLGLAAPEALFAISGPDPAFVPFGVPYLRLVLVLSFGMAGTMLFGAILGGAGDTTTPLLVTLLQTAVAILAEWVLIFGHLGAPALGTRGVALGIATGQIVAISAGVAVLFRGGARVHLRPRHLRPDPAVLRRIAALAWPAALQMAGGVVAVLVFLRLAGGFGPQVQAAYAIGVRLGMIGPMLSFPLASACSTLVGQALGAGDRRRAWRAIGVGVLVHGALMWSFAAAVFWLRSEIMALLADDPEVIRVGADYLRYAAGTFVCWAFLAVFLRSLQGAGDVFVPMLISLSGAFLVALPLAFGLTRGAGLGPTGVWIAALANSAFTTAASGAWLATGRWARHGAS
jgi:putative MATE family efflux protein